MKDGMNSRKQLWAGQPPDAEQTIAHIQERIVEILGDATGEKRLYPHNVGIRRNPSSYNIVLPARFQSDWPKISARLQAVLGQTGATESLIAFDVPGDRRLTLKPPGLSVAAFSAQAPAHLGMPPSPERDRAWDVDQKWHDVFLLQLDARLMEYKPPEVPPPPRIR